MSQSIGDNLKRIRLLKGLSLKDAGVLLGMSATAIQKYENSIISPNSTKLIEFSKAYNVSISELLYSYSIPAIEFTSFRKKKRLTGKNLEVLKDLLHLRIAKYLEVLDLIGRRYNYVSKISKYSCASLEDAEKCAEQFREEVLKVNSFFPLSNLTDVLENLGVCIVYIENIDHKFDDFDGFSEIVDGIPVIVLLKEMMDGARLRFTLAHELGHLVMEFNDNVDEEKCANRFASSLLMPKDAFFREFGEVRKSLSFYELEQIKREYKVSYAAIIYRLKELGVISDSYYVSLHILINKKIGIADPNPIPVEVSSQFEKLVTMLETTGIINSERASEILEITKDEYNRQYHNYGH